MKSTPGKRRRRIFGGLAGGALAAVAVLFVVTASGTAASQTPPRNKTRPSIAGKAQQGQTLTADHGDWGGGNPSGFRYQWLRCGGGGCNEIGNANGKTYAVTGNDVGHRLRVRVTAFNADGSDSATSKATDVVSGAGGEPPRTSSQPRIVGTPREGQALTAQPNSWSGTQPIHLSYRWQRCNAGGGDCGGTGVQTQRYFLHGADVGHTLRVVVTATNRVGSSSAVSDPSPVIQLAGSNPPPPPSGCASVSTVSLPNQLVIDRIDYSPSRIHSRDEPLVARFHVTSTKGGCVAGALVYAVGVPFDRLSKAPETATDGSGWATITFRVLPTFELRRGNLVVIFVRARKPGEGILAGVSARRLVSVRVG